MISNSDLGQAISIVQSEQFTRKNYQTLVALAEETGDRRIGDMIEAFIAAAPNLEFMDDGVDSGNDIQALVDSAIPMVPPTV
jgi:hypothetical protein